MIRLIVFDLDNTLCATGEGMTEENVALLRRLEESGARIAIASGKPTYYLCGFARQIGLKAPVFVGENGAVIHIGVELPPSGYHVMPYSPEAKRSLALLREEIDRVLPGMWYQPNVTALTPFPTSEREFEVIEEIVARLGSELKDIIIYRHADSFDITPEGITKKSGVKRLGELLGVAPQETAAVGDGVNDYPMFEYAGLSVGVNVKEPERVDRNFASIGEALAFLLDSMRENC